MKLKNLLTLAPYLLLASALNFNAVALQKPPLQFAPICPLMVAKLVKYVG